jgi:hypothetical protein
MRLLAHKEGLPTEVALLLFEFSDLLAEFFFHIADHAPWSRVGTLSPARGIWRVWLLLPAFPESDP